jgi:hypothetical protein
MINLQLPHTFDQDARILLILDRAVAATPDRQWYLTRGRGRRKPGRPKAWHLWGSGLAHYAAGRKEWTSWLCSGLASTGNRS